MKKNWGSPHWFRIYGGLNFAYFWCFPCFLEKGYAFYGVSDVTFNKNYMTKFRSNNCVFYFCVPVNRIWRKYFRRNQGL